MERSAGSDLKMNNGRDIEDAIRVLEEGGVVAYPTDTVYGLGADMSSPEAIRRVLEIKGRSPSMGLPLLLADATDLDQVAIALQSRGGGGLIRKLASMFWPGALTLIVSRTALIPDLVTGGRDTVAVRVPDHFVPRGLIRSLGRPITGTSANYSGHPSLTTAQEVHTQLGTDVDMVIESAQALNGIDSTILDVSGPVARVLRRGAIHINSIQECLAELGEPLALN